MSSQESAAAPKSVPQRLSTTEEQIDARSPALILPSPCAFLWPIGNVLHDPWRLPCWTGHVLKDCLVKCWPGIAFKSALPSGHFIQHETKGKHIRADIQLLASNLLRRHVSCRANCHAGASESEIGIEFLRYVGFFIRGWSDISRFRFLQFS